LFCPPDRSVSRPEHVRRPEAVLTNNCGVHDVLYIINGVTYLQFCSINLIKNVSSRKNPTLRLGCLPVRGEARIHEPIEFSRDQEISCQYNRKLEADGRPVHIPQPSSPSALVEIPCRQLP